MTQTTIQTMTPSERLAAIVAAGIAAYQSRWPDLAREPVAGVNPVVDAEAVTDKTEPTSKRAPRRATSRKATSRKASAKPVTSKTEPAPRVDRRDRAQSDTDCQAADEAAPVPNIFLSEKRQREICLSCPLATCVGVERPNCPIRVAQRAEWREKNRKQPTFGQSIGA